MTELMVVMGTISVLGLLLSSGLAEKKRDAERRIAVAYGKNPLEYEIERGNIDTAAAREFLTLSEDEQQTLWEFWTRNGEYDRQVELVGAKNEILTVNAAQALFTANDLAALGLGGVTGLIRQGDAAADIVFRVIRSDENPALGLFPKNASANYSVEGFVLNGSRKGFASQYIATTRDVGVARAWALRDNLRVVAIDLNKVDSTTIIDLSTTMSRNTWLRSSRARGYAATSREVLIEGNVPANAVLPFVPVQ
jgi:hypothetical protein